MKTLKRYVDCHVHGPINNLVEIICDTAICYECVRAVLFADGRQKASRSEYEQVVARATRLPMRCVVHRSKPDPSVCDARCMHATGQHCDCICGGKNHGALAHTKRFEQEAA